MQTLFSTHFFHTKTLSPFDVCLLVMRYSVLVLHLWSEPKAYRIHQLRSTRRIPRELKERTSTMEGGRPTQKQLVYKCSFPKQ